MNDDFSVSILLNVEQILTKCKEEVTAEVTSTLQQTDYYAEKILFMYEDDDSYDADLLEEMLCSDETVWSDILEPTGHGYLNRTESNVESECADIEVGFNINEEQLRAHYDAYVEQYEKE